MPTVPIPEEVFEQLCEENPEMAAKVVKSLHESAQRRRQKRLNEEGSNES